MICMGFIIYSARQRHARSFANLHNLREKLFVAREDNPRNTISSSKRSLSPYLVTSNFILEQFSTRSLVTNDANVFAERERRKRQTRVRDKERNSCIVTAHFPGIRGVVTYSRNMQLPLRAFQLEWNFDTAFLEKKKRKKIVRVRSLRNFSLSTRVDRCDTRYIGVFLDRSRNETRNGTYSVRYSRLGYDVAVVVKTFYRRGAIVHLIL